MNARNGRLEKSPNYLNAKQMVQNPYLPPLQDASETNKDEEKWRSGFQVYDAPKNKFVDVRFLRKLQA